MRKLLSPRNVLFALIVFALSAAISTPSQAQIRISVGFGPPPLPVYEQPICPGDGYLWTPGYWAWDADIDDYYWIPGTWILAPEVGFLWTPPYWGWADGAFIFYDGYWGPEVGFYGGIDYGFGYTGSGYEGGYWRGRDFFYNRSVNNVNGVNIRNVYNRTVVNNVRTTRVAFNGGPGGINARPTAAEMTAEHERHIAATSLQEQHRNLARQDRAQFASVNHGKPSVMASSRPAQFHAQAASRAGGAAARSAKTPAANRNAERPQGRTPSAASRSAHPQAPRATAEPKRNAERPEGRAPSAASRATHTPEHTQPRQEKAPVRNAERPQTRTPESRPEPQAKRSQPSHAAEPNRNAGSHPPAQERRSNPPAEKKAPAHSSEPRR